MYDLTRVNALGFEGSFRQPKNVSYETIPITVQVPSAFLEFTGPPGSHCRQLLSYKTNNLINNKKMGDRTYDARTSGRISSNTDDVTTHR